MQTHSLAIASSAQPPVLADNAELAAPSSAVPTLHAPTSTAPSHFSAMPAPAPDPAYDNDEDDDDDMAAWVTSLAQTLGETDVTQTHALQKCFRDLDQLREALSRGASLPADPAAASGLARALRDLLQELMRHVQAGVVDLHMAGPEMICAICSGLGLLAELHSARLIRKADQASLPALLSELSAALAKAVRSSHTVADASDVDATLALLTWLSRALKARLLYADDKTLRPAYTDGLACMRDWVGLSTDAAQRKCVLNSRTLAVCFVQLNTIRQYRLLHLDGDAPRARAHRAELQQLLESLCAALPGLLSGKGVQLANVCNTLKDYIDAGLLPDSTDGWLMPCITLLLQRMPSVPHTELMRRGGQTLANYANFLRVLAEAGVQGKASFVGCAAGYRDACDWLTRLLGSEKFQLKGRCEQSLANLMSYVKAMSRLADRAARTKEPGIVRQHWSSLKLAAQRLVALAHARLSRPGAVRLSPMSISGMLLALWDFEQRGMATAQLCRPLVQRLIAAIPNCAGTEWEGETMAMCLRAVVHLHAQQGMDTSGMRAAFEHLLHLLGKHAVGTEVHELYCLQALRLGLQQKWAAIDAPPLQKALRKLLAWKAEGSPGMVELEAAIARLAHQEEARPVLPNAGFDEDGSAAEPDTPAWTPPGGKLAAVTAGPQLKPSTTYRAPTDTAPGQQARLVSSTKESAASAGMGNGIDDDDTDHHGDPLHEWFLLSSGRRNSEDALARMQSLCNAHPELLNALDAGGNHALYYAIVNGQQALARWLMAQEKLSLGMPRDDFIERLADGLLDSANARQAKQVYSEFIASSREATASLEEDEPASARSDHGAGSANRGKTSKRAHGQATGARNRRAKQESDWDQIGKAASANPAGTKAPTDPKEQYRLAERYLTGDGVTQSDKLAFEWFAKAAEQGYPPAQHSVGAMYLDGTGTRKNDALAFQWLGKAAMQNHPLAQHTLAHLHAKGIGTKRDSKLAFDWLCQAAHQAFAPAQYSLGINYRDGIGVERNHALAFQWLSKAAAKGLPDAQYMVGVMYEAGEYIESDPVLSFEWFSKAAAQGMAQAQLNLGLKYRDGSGCGKDMENAFKWFSMAAEQGLADAQFALALMYREGDGVEKNIRLAMRWLGEAAAQGNPKYQYELGLMYLRSDASWKHQKLAFLWISKAAAQGLAIAECNVGAMYEDGKGVKADAVLAFEWTRKAAVKGLVTAQYNLAGMYSRGRGVKQDLRLAFQWTVKAATQGMPMAQYQLAILYVEGRGVEVNVPLARKWLIRAAQGGFPLASATLQRLEQGGVTEDDRH